MARIQVEPAHLHETANKLAESAVRIRALGADTLKAGLGAPSYDGQFGPQVRNLGEEANAALTAKAGRLEQLGGELHAIATAFAEADAESETVFEALGQQLMNLLRQAGPILGTLISLEPSGTPVPQTTPKPLVTPVPVPTVPLGTPVPTPVPERVWEYQRQLALNARYGFCVHPLTDPDALSNNISTVQLTVVRPPFGSVPGSAPGEPWEGLTNNRFLLSLKAFSLINQAFRREANWSALEQADANVEVDLHYARYEEGVRVAGVEVRNQSDSELGVYQVRIDEFKVAPDGSSFPWRAYYQRFQDSYVSPNGAQILYFNQIEEQFPNESRLHIQLMVTTVEYERMYRWPAWELDVATGQAVPAEPEFYDTN